MKLEPLQVARLRLAGALGSSCRRLWRRSDLGKDDLVILDLMAEALQRLGKCGRPGHAAHPMVTLAEGPPRIVQQVTLLAALATREVGFATFSAPLNDSDKPVAETTEQCVVGNSGGKDFIPAGIAAKGVPFDKRPPYKPYNSEFFQPYNPDFFQPLPKVESTAELHIHSIATVPLNDSDKAAAETTEQRVVGISGAPFAKSPTYRPYNPELSQPLPNVESSGEGRTYSHDGAHDTQQFASHFLLSKSEQAQRVKPPGSALPPYEAVVAAPGGAGQGLPQIPLSAEAQQSCQQQ